MTLPLKLSQVLLFVLLLSCAGYSQTNPAGNSICTKESACEIVEAILSNHLSQTQIDSLKPFSVENDSKHLLTITGRKSAYSDSLGLTIKVKINQNNAEITLFQLSGKMKHISSYLIPDKRTAQRVGKAVIASVFGRPVLAEHEPFSSVKKKGYWIVTGSFKLKGKACGGVPEVRFSSQNAKVIFVTHGK